MIFLISGAQMLFVKQEKRQAHCGYTFEGSSMGHDCKNDSYNMFSYI